MFRFIKKVFVLTMSFFSCNALKCCSMNNQECKVRREVLNINSKEPSFYPYSVKISKSSGSCVDINDPHAKLCVPDVSKNMNVKVFNLISRTNETRYIKWHENCEWKCRLDASACSNKQTWNEDKCRCECKELIDKGICDKGFNWNPSNYECEYDKSCDVAEYLDYKNCKCRKILVDKLIEDCSENIDEKALRNYEKICISCTIYIVLFVMFFHNIISISISSVFIYFTWYLKRKHIKTTTYWVQCYWMQFHWTCKWEILNKLISKIVQITLLMTWSILKTFIQAY